MSHWFLCARDVMWFCVAIAPVALAGAGATGLTRENEADQSLGCWMVIAALFVQAILIFALYDGEIR